MLKNPFLQGVCRAAACAVVIWLAGGTVSGAQQAPPATPVPGPARPLTLNDVLDLAEARSEQIAIAQFGVARAIAGEQRARSERFPQIGASASYDRTLRSEFSGLFSGEDAGPPCEPFTLMPSRPLDARVGEIERAIDCGAVGGAGMFGGGGDLSELPFGQANAFRLNLSFSQAVYAGGRIDAQERLAAAGRRVADGSLRASRAQLRLDATQAFYDAALADRLVEIAEATLQQAEATLAQVELSYKAGRLPEFEWLRARVARDNQRPNVIRVRASRTVAYLRLKQLLEIPAPEPVAVAADLDDAVLPPPDRFSAALASVRSVAASTTALARVPVQQAAEAVAAREASLRIARSERLPFVSVNSLLGEVAYAGLPGFDDWRTNWTIGASLSLPLFNGGRTKANITSAGTELGEARARQKLALELAEAETEGILAVLDAAVAAWEASAGTVEQAMRAYGIAEMRYREGISTQLELLDARLVLQQAQVNRAQAARDVQIARTRVALLPDLPLGSAAASGGAANGSSGGY